MYLVEEEGNVDVELLAECGQIAQRLRALEQTWYIELKELQRNSLRSFGKPLLTSSISLTQKLNDIFDINDNECNNLSSELVNRLRYLEDIAIKIHKQQEFLKQAAEGTLEQKRNSSETHNKAHININMNYSTSSGNNSNNNSNVNSSINNNNDLLATTAARENTREHGESYLNTSVKKTGSSRDNNNRSSANNNDADDDDDKSKSSKIASATVSSNQSQTIHHQHQQLCDNITNEDLILLLRELKRKVDYTEKMNWLCKLRSNAN